MDINAYIFDMDGVLCDSEPLIAEAACRMFKETYGVSVVPADFAPFVGTGEDRYLGGVAQKAGVTIQLPRDKDVTYHLYAQAVPGRLQPVPGVIDFIRNARASGIKLAVATSADAFKMRVNLEALGLDPAHFSALVTGEDIEHKKPAPDIFLAAAAKMAVPPARCVVFEDAVNGVQAARAAGMRCVGLTTFFDAADLTAAGADATWPDFNQAQPGAFAC